VDHHSVMKNLCAAAAMLALMSGAAQAHYLTGNDWVHWCNQDRCHGYILGIADGLEMMTAARIANHGDISGMACVPAGVDGNQLIAAAAQWMRRNRQDWHKPAALLLGIAIQEAWPCK
jgi:hypothetical protein